MGLHTRNKKVFTLSEELPELSAELQKLLNQAGEPTLAASVPQLPIVDRCRCGDDFCATFNVKYTRTGDSGIARNSIPLDPEEGMIIVDVVNGELVSIEVLYRDKIRQKLLALFP